MGEKKKAVRRIPDLEPIKDFPVLHTVNGFGVSFWGWRDRDPATGTYVKTVCLCALFMPIFAMRAYRVADADYGGWHILNRVALSWFAKAWNVFFITTLLILIVIVWWVI